MEIFTNENIIFYLIAYFVGGIPFGLILAKLFGGVDIKNSGSKSIGATNVLRVIKEKDPTLAKKLAVATLVLDALKGVLVLVVATILGASEETKWAIAVLAVVGHCFSPYLWFEGGKGVATGFGVLLYMIPYATIVSFIVWAISAKTIKISSLSSLLALFTLVGASFIIYPQIDVIKTHAPIILIAFFILYKHSENIKKLILFQEKRVV